MNSREELQRRATLVTQASASMPMLSRIRAASLLLRDCHWMSPEQWERRFENWQRNPEAATVDVSPIGSALGEHKRGESDGD